MVAAVDFAKSVSGVKKSFQVVVQLDVVRLTIVVNLLASYKRSIDAVSELQWRELRG